MFHLGHWEPLKKQPSWSPISHDNLTMRVLHSLFPEFDSHFFTDIWKKRELFADDQGLRRTDEDLYASNPLRPIHHNFTKKLLSSSTADVIIVWGGAAKIEFQQEWGKDDTISISGLEVSSIVFNLMINDSVSVFLIPFFDALYFLPSRPARDQRFCFGVSHSIF